MGSETRIIAVINEKGGVGKSTISYNLAGAVAEKGKKVLLMDLDKQTNATSFSGVEANSEATINEVLLGKIAAHDAIVPRSRNFWVLPGSKQIYQTETLMFAEVGRERILKEAMEGITKYDYILVDCPPSLGLLTVNALTFAKEILVALQPEPASLDGMAQLFDTFKKIKGRMNPELRIGGVICNFMTNKALHREVLGEIRSQLGDLVFETAIPNWVAYAEATGHGKTIAEYRPKGRETEIIATLAKELMKRKP